LDLPGVFKREMVASSWAAAPIWQQETIAPMLQLPGKLLSDTGRAA